MTPNPPSCPHPAVGVDPIVPGNGAPVAVPTVPVYPVPPPDPPGPPGFPLAPNPPYPPPGDVIGVPK